jgi:hypothetical protein
MLHFCPRLRTIEVKPVQHFGRTSYLLRDLLWLAGKESMLPAQYGVVLVLLDGEHDLPLIRAKLLLR